VIELLKLAGKVAIPTRTNIKDPRPGDRDKACHLNGSFFAKLKQDRASATRCDMRAMHFLVAIYLVAIVICLNCGHASRYDI
jgi:hypothetical protein